MKALWIKREDLVRNSLISGNLDTDKFIQFIAIAQDIHLQNYTGTECPKIEMCFLSGGICCKDRLVDQMA